MVFVWIYAAIYGWVFLVSLWVLFQTKRFLAVTPCIADEQSLERFKKLARTNMFLALLQILWFIAGLIAGALLIFRYGLIALAGVILANGVVLALSLYMRGFEQRARSLPAANETLAAEHRRISESWVKKPFPDF